MRSRWIDGAMLVTLLVVGTGSSVSGVREAAEWKYAGDIARAQGQLFEAHVFYAKVAQTFPGTPHGRSAARYSRYTAARLTTPARSPASETPCSWVGEFIDFLTWP